MGRQIFLTYEICILLRHQTIVAFTLLKIENFIESFGR